MITINIPDVTPVSKLRHRTTLRGKKHISYTPKKTADYEKIVSAYAKKAMGSIKPFSSGVLLCVLFNFETPKSWTVQKKQDALDGQSLHTSKPDVDNLLKAVKDALNKIAYEDDSLVSVVFAAKQYSLKPGVFILVEEINDIDTDGLANIFNVVK